MDAPAPLSVIVGSSDARTTVEACLGALVGPCRRVGAELIVVDNSEDGTDALVRERFPDIRLLRTPDTRYIPELWGVGIEASEGAVVALTTAHCVPASDWVDCVLEAHATSSAAGIGGAIENDPAGTTTDWAIYFCRYHAFMPPLEAGSVRDIAGDNASYKRWALDRYREAWRDGFWEPDVHAEILREGGELHLDPSIVVRHRHSFDARSFVRNRFRHGQQYGGSRGGRLEVGGRIARVLGAPLVPAVLTGSVARAVLRDDDRDRGSDRRRTAHFVRSLPLIGLFYASWAVGEAAGYLGSGRGGA